MTRFATYVFGLVTLVALGCQLGLAAELPVAATVPVAGAPGEPGMVIRYNDERDAYEVSTTAFDAHVYGVVGERPAIVFMTSTTSVPVVTGGVTLVRVSTVGGEIRRGDLLTTSDQVGVAMYAGTTTTAVFAVALEDAAGKEEILAEVDVTRAQALQREQQEVFVAAQAAAQEESEEGVSLARRVFAGVLVLLALGFLLYTFRTILNSSVLSIGRNPRARLSLIMVAIGSMVLALVLALVTVLAAIGVLVLPVL